MKVLAPDILELTRTLSPVVLGLGLVIGLWLWIYGTIHQRFWLAVLITLVGGLIGLLHGPDYGIQPLVAGLLLALVAGALVLSLLRILLFLCGGLASLALIQTLQTGWNEVVCFLCGGLVGVLVPHLWISVLSAFLGSVLMSYSALSLLERYAKVPCTAWAGQHGPLLSWAVAACTLTGLLFQFLVERRRKRKQSAKTAEAPAGPPAPTKLTLWSWWRRIPIPQISWRKAG